MAWLGLANGRDSYAGMGLGRQADSFHYAQVLQAVMKGHKRVCFTADYGTKMRKLLCQRILTLEFNRSAVKRLPPGAPGLAGVALHPHAGDGQRTPGTGNDVAVFIRIVGVAFVLVLPTSWIMLIRMGAGWTGGTNKHNRGRAALPRRMITLVRSVHRAATGGIARHAARHPAASGPDTCR
jgi:hypothetical protein